ncbi:putative pyruvate oxidase [Lentilactobacillus parafarraginis F0439]|uniref:Putative pyruvate oxidase n=2 Tax=Lentilactobacillus parafarraginis TaxID=390842 RepID=G9ZRX8_9LACO|nr:putative pyruvate oxidase [Lentilactobacillus parafarraginis F0439]
MKISLESNTGSDQFMSQTGADELVQVLEDWGVSHVYGLPGDSIDTTVDGLRKKQANIKFIQVRHEEVGALAAASEAKLTGKLGVCLSIGGPGAIHMLNGLYDAKMDHAPVLALLGQVKSNLLNTDYFQEVNTPKLFDDVAVYNREIKSVKQIPKIVDEAIREAYAHHGVAVLTIPDDIPEGSIKSAYHSSAKSFQLPKPTAPDDQVTEAVKLLNAAKKPIALIGRGARDASTTVQKFVETYQIPFVQTLPAKGTIADDHPNSLGNVGKLGTKPAYEAMREADMLILIGTNYPYVNFLPKPGKAKCVQIEMNPLNLNRRYPADVAINADSGKTISQILASGLRPSDGQFLKACQEDMANWNKWMHGKRSLDSEPVAPESLFDYVHQTAPKNTVFSIDVGTATSWSARFLPIEQNQKFLISANLGTMGCALPGAIAAQAAYPNRPTIAINGDGAFAMVMEDFVTAVKYKMPLICIVLNNQKLAFIEYEQQEAGQLNYQIDLKDVDYAKFADACGSVGITAKSNAEFRSALDRAYKITDRPVLINTYVADNAPLPGKIVNSEAAGYLSFGLQYVGKHHKIPELPPLKDIMRQFF